MVKELGTVARYWKDPADCIIRTVGFGGDTDTTAAMVALDLVINTVRPRLTHGFPCRWAHSWGRCTGRAGCPGTGTTTWRTVNTGETIACELGGMFILALCCTGVILIAGLLLNEGDLRRWISTR